MLTSETNLIFLSNLVFTNRSRYNVNTYNQRRDFLLEMLPIYWGKKIHIYGAAAGIHIVVGFEDVSFTDERVIRLMQSGVYIVLVAQHSLIEGTHTNEIIPGYTGLPKSTILKGLDLLSFGLNTYEI